MADAGMTTLTLPEMLRQAIVHHQAGRLAEAENLYRAVLGQAPDHPEASHNLGVLAIQVGRADVALPLLRAAVAAAPGRAEYWLAVIECALRLGQRDAAAQALAQARRQGIPEAALAPLAGHLAGPDPAELSSLAAMFAAGRHAEGRALAQDLTSRFPGLVFGWKALGLFLHQSGLAGAGPALRRALALDPLDAEGWHALAGIEGGGGGAACCHRALRLRPGYAEALDTLGRIALADGDLAAAEACCRAALAAQPGLAAAHDDLGVVLRRRGRGDAARSRHRIALALAPAAAEALNHFGVALQDGGDLAAAARSYRRAVAARPGLAEGWGNLGAVLADQGRPGARAALCRALALRPAEAGAWTDLGGFAFLDRRFEAAETACRRAIALAPGHAQAHWNLSQPLLATGRYAEGWQEYEWRLRLPQAAAWMRPYPEPRWTGQPAAGRTLLVHAEQGFGDTLLACRYIPLVARRGIRVVIEVPTPLARLMRGLDGVAQVVATGDVLPPFDLQCPMMSLPLACGTVPDGIPAAVPYLAADRDLRAAWHRRVDAIAAGRFKVGLLWAGNPQMAADRRRSIPAAQLAGLAALPGICLFGLQKEPAGPPPPFGDAYADLMGEVSDFADTAGLLSALDLVIAVDSAVLHLAGAIGRPAWLLARRDTDWRWLDGREDSPWYPTVRVFAQAVPERWDDVLARVGTALAEIATPRGPG